MKLGWKLKVDKIYTQKFVDVVYLKTIDKNVEYFPRNLHKTSSYLAKAMKALQAVNEMKGIVT